MDVETTKPTNTWAIQCRTRQFRLIATCAVFVVSNAAVFAEVATVGNVDPAFLSEAGIGISTDFGTFRTALRASPALGQARQFGSSGATSVSARTAARPVRSNSPPRLRLDPALTSLASTASGSGRMLPVGELNRAGIVRARTMQIRAGTLYLVGGYADHEEAAQLDGDHAVSD